MKQRLLALVLAAGCVVLGIIAFLVHVGQDRTPPKITIEEAEVTYAEGDDYGALLEGVSAKDNKDGDITDKVFIDKIVQTSEDTATVYYGVIDSSKNVGTAKRKVAYQAGDGTSEDSSGDTASEEGENPEENSADEGVDPAVQAAEANVAALNLQPDGERPVMALTAEGASIKAGETFDPISVVAGAIDDKDSIETLYQHIHAEGEYNTQAPGAYEIRYYVSDSDGNTSDPHIFTLTVE